MHLFRRPGEGRQRQRLGRQLRQVLLARCDEVPAGRPRSSKALGSAEISHASAGGESASFNTRAFTVQTSTNGTTWTTRATVTNNTAAVTTHSVTGVTARYVRLNITTPTQGTDPAARIYELKAFA